MNTARVVVLSLAVGAGGIAAFLASRTEAPPPAQLMVEKAETTDVLVARSDIALGQTLTASDLQWVRWPAEAASSSFIRRTERPEALDQIAGSIARSPFVAGEPMRESKLVKANGSGFMAAILPSGMRAVSTEISPETGAGGFILPNDRVDVILSRRYANPERTGPDIVISEIVLSNIRVLAVDQAVEEKNGQKVVVGKTATLELKPEQTELLARSRQSGTLSLALRSIVDANAPDARSDDGKIRRDTVNVVRFGVPSSQSIQK
jgi:pilus assembly protein CpaB